MINCSRFIVSRSRLLHLHHRTTPTPPPVVLSVLRSYTVATSCRSSCNGHSHKQVLRRFPPESGHRHRLISTSRIVANSAEQLRNRQPTPEPARPGPNPSSSSDEITDSTPTPPDDELEHITLKLTPEQVQELTRGDEELIRKIKLIQMEHELARQDGARVPPNPIKLRKWKELLELGSRSQRMKYFNYLWNCQMGDESAKRKKREKAEKRAAELNELPPFPTPEEDPLGVCYGLGRNTLFLRLYDSTQNRFFHSRLVSAALFNQTLVIDCSYDEHMTKAESKNCAGQLEYLFSENRIRAKEPLNVILCNVNKSGVFYDALVRRIPTIHDDGYMVEIFEESYLDLFPKERLVYLTPHAKDDLIVHNDDDVYIVGAMVDKSDPRPFSMAKAKREGLRTAKLPLDQYLEWGGGSGKSLTVNQMASILIDFNNTKDWAYALRHVPTRKLRRADDQSNPTDRFILQQPKRKERKSQVLLDFDTETSRKGFGFKGSRGSMAHELNRGQHRPNLKSILLEMQRRGHFCLRPERSSCLPSSGSGRSSGRSHDSLHFYCISSQRFCKCVKRKCDVILHCL